MAETADDFTLPSLQAPKRPARPSAEESASDFRLPSLPPPTEYEKDWGAAPWGEVYEGFKKELLPSIGRGIAAIPQAIMNPSETVEGLKQLGVGLKSKAEGLFEDQNAADKAEKEAALNAVIEPFTSVAGFKKALGTDPYSVLSLAAIPVSAGASAAGAGAKALGTASLAGKALRGAELAGKTTAGVMDPIYGSIQLAGAGYEKFAKPAAKALVSDVSGVPQTALETAYQAGKSGDKSLQSAFNTFAKGQGKAEDFSRTVSKASKQMEEAEIAAWAADKKNALALQQVVPSKPIFDAIAKARETLGPRELAIGPARKAHAQLDILEQRMRDRFAMPETSNSRTLTGFDMLKRELYEMGEKHPSEMVGNAIKQVNAGVRQAMSSISPQYVSLMEKYQLLQDKLKTIRKTLATGDNVSAVRELNTFIRGLDDAEKNRFISELAKYDPRIPYMVSGAAIHQAAGQPSNWSKAFSAGTLGNIAWGLQRGDPMHWLSAAGAYALGKVFGTPGAAGSTAYGLGKLSRGAEIVGEALPPGTAAVTGTAARLTPSVLSRMENEQLQESIRPTRATGGRITAESLITAAERAKKEVNKTTEPLLNHDDSTVARALEVANRNIEG